ncbi:LuxR family transcriptional regulator [Actinomycetospora sp.]|jgi:quercetin dioxygenase-like cupin family protein|uniref:LuxR family transcriptional regulator n=1 Tax=Actinomycetospora sp. TaxID=1872135 RepID=UPI002F404DBA
MQKLSLDALARELLERATASTSGRAARTVHGGHEHSLRQTLIALTAGSALAEHESPGEATLQVHSGRIRLVAGGDSWDGRRGDLLIIPAASHRLEASESSVVLLTVVVR